MFGELHGDESGDRLLDVGGGCIELNAGIAPFHIPTLRIRTDEPVFGQSELQFQFGAFFQRLARSEQAASL